MGLAGPGGDQITGNSNDDKRHGAERDGRGSRAEFTDGSTVDPDRFRDLLTGPTEGSDPRAVASHAEDTERVQGRHSVAIVDDHLDLRELLSVRLGMVPGLNVVGVPAAFDCTVI